MALTRPQVLKVVNNYIGAVGGYRGDFTYKSHEKFYPDYCDLDDVVIDYEDGITTRYRFIDILLSRPSLDRAKILHGVIEKFGVDDDGNARRTRLRNEIEGSASASARRTTSRVEFPVAQQPGLSLTIGVTSG
jgi:hypothetical protein